MRYLVLSLLLFFQTLSTVARAECNRSFFAEAKLLREALVEKLDQFQNMDALGYDQHPLPGMKCSVSVTPMDADGQFRITATIFETESGKTFSSQTDVVPSGAMAQSLCLPAIENRSVRAPEVVRWHSNDLSINLQTKRIDIRERRSPSLLQMVSRQFGFSNLPIDGTECATQSK